MRSCCRIFDGEEVLKHPPAAIYGRCFNRIPANGLDIHHDQQLTNGVLVLQRGAIRMLLVFEIDICHFSCGAGSNPL